MAFFEGCPGGTHRSWPGGRGGRPRLDSREGSGKGWLGGKAGWVNNAGRGVREAGQGLGGGARASVPQRVSYFCRF